MPPSENESHEKLVVLFLAFCLVTGVVASFLLLSEAGEQFSGLEALEKTPILHSQPRQVYSPIVVHGGEDLIGYSTIRLPAVIEDENDSTGYSGTFALLRVVSTEGSGNIFVNINNVVAAEDTQESVRMAAIVAADYLNTSLEDKDLYYNFIVDSTSLEGPSAGASIAVATVAALSGAQLKSDVMMTGTINHDYTIGPSSGIIYKARAAKQANASVFLVPLGTRYYYNDTLYCRSQGVLGREFCIWETHPVDVERAVGIRVIEVGNLSQALDYFLENDPLPEGSNL